MHPFLQQLLQGQAVEWKTLGEVANLNRGRVMSKTYLADNIGEYPVYSSQTANNGEIGKINTFDFEGEFITWTTDGANAGTVFYRNEKFSITNVCGLITLKYDYLTYKFLFYWLSIQAKKHVYSGMGNPKLMSNQMEKIQIPIPPLSVQSQIVQILDTFTELTAELTAELSMRRKQYQYYRDFLLSEHELAKVGFEWKSLGEVFHLKNGYTPSKSNKEYWENGTIPWFRMEDIRENGRILDYALQQVSESAVKGGKLFPANSIIMATTATIGEHALVTVNCLSNQQLTNFSIKNEFSKLLDIKFAFHYFFIIDEQAKKIANKSSMPIISLKELSKLLIPIPPLSVQSEIVAILDTFDTLVSSISEGLPKEIQLRQKQYEYYRELLLDFHPNQE